jgi:hypothetical protein
VRVLLRQMTQTAFAEPNTLALHSNLSWRADGMGETQW